MCGRLLTQCWRVNMEAFIICLLSIALFYTLNEVH